MPYSEKLNLVFIPIPKSGGELVDIAMQGYTDVTKTWRDYDLYSINIKSPKSFSIVRNPWDRVFACYNDCHLDENSDYDLLKNYTFKDCVKMLYNNRELLDLPVLHRPAFKHGWGHQHSYIFDGRKLQVDQIMRFEFMDEVDEYLKDVYGIDVSHTDTTTNYKDHYDDEMIRIVSEIYKDDIALLGYVY